MNGELEMPCPISNLVKEHSLYMLSECLTNISKHAKASKVEIFLKKKRTTFSLNIVDNGVGMNTSCIGKRAGQYGLIDLVERTQLVGGKVIIQSQKNRGTSVNLIMPLQHKELDYDI